MSDLLDAMIALGRELDDDYDLCLTERDQERVYGALQNHPRYEQARLADGSRELRWRGVRVIRRG